MKNIYFTMLVLVASGPFAGAACAQENRPPEVKSLTAVEKGAREVKGRELISTARPAVRIKFDDDFKYVGTQSFVLYNVAHAEQHFFVEADRQGNIRRLYWVQFEGYLPDNKHTYDYKSARTVNLGGLEFFADSRPANLSAQPPPPDSDGARARAFLASKNLRTASDDILLQRLIHLTDATRRNELLIIYVEDLATTGLTAADLAPGGSAASRWPEMSKALLERATKGVKIQR